MRKTIRFGVVGLTRSKRKILENEYFNFQWWMQFGIDKGVYSVTKSYKGWRIKIIKHKEYPLPLNNNYFAFEKNSATKLTPYWAKIPIGAKRGGIWLPLKTKQFIPEGITIRDSFIIFKNGDFYFHLVIEKEISLKTSYSSVHSIDLGIRHIACSVDSLTHETTFYSKELRSVRGKYYYLRKKLGKLKNLKQIIKIKDKERKKVNSLLHSISNDIIAKAEKNNAFIAIGKLKGIRKNSKGKRFNRKLNSFPYFRLSQYISYKAGWKGIKVVLVNEAYTSITCSKCGEKGIRSGKHHGLFVCNVCKYQDDANRNGSINIGKRALGHVSSAGVLAHARKTVFTLKNSQA